MNYLPDPALSALAAYRRAYHPKATPTPIAWISNYPNRDLWKHPDHFVYAYFSGASRRAEEMGYHLEHFWLREPGMTPQRLSKILYHRGINGILLAPQFKSFTHMNMDWDKFCAVTFGYSLTRPRLHLTTSNHYRSMGMIVRKLRSLGYRRIGLVLDAFHDRRVLHSHYASYLMEMLSFPAKIKIPAFFEREHHPNLHKETVKWYRAHRPEVIIASNDGCFGRLLQSEGLRCPEDIGLVMLGMPPRYSEDPEKNFSGIDENLQDTGVAALDLLVTLMHRNERGVPVTPRTVLIDSKWVDGKTIRRLNVDQTTDKV